MKIKESEDSWKLEHHIGAFVEKPLYDKIHAAAKMQQRPVSQWLRIILEKATEGVGVKVKR